MFRIPARRSIVALFVVVNACSDPAGPTGILPETVSLDIISGNNQTALEYTQLPQPIVVRMLNSKGKPVAGQVVNFRVVQGGGSVFGGAAVTDRNGIAQDWWTLGSAGIRNLLEARVVDPTTGQQIILATVLAVPQPLINPVVQFRCNNQPDWTPPNSGPLPGECYGTSQFVPSFSNGQVVTVHVRVVHDGNVPVPNMWLDFYASHNSGPASGPSVAPVYGVTNALGTATTIFTIGNVQALNTLDVLGPAGISRYQDFKAGY